MSPSSHQSSPQEQRSPGEIYEQHMVPAIFAAWVPALVELLSLIPGQSVLDVACGTGSVTRQLLSQIGSEGQIVGLDINPNMLDMANRIAPEIQWHEDSALELPFFDEQFDAVICQQGLQFFPDKLKALREMHRVLAPDGKLALALWCAIETSPGHQALAQALARCVNQDAATLMSSAFGLGEARAICDLLGEAGFREIEIRQEERMARFPSPDEFTTHVVMGSVLGRTGVKLSDTVLRELIDDVNETLQPYTQPDGLIFPMQAHLVRATT